jgi:hypothetical protein
MISLARMLGSALIAFPIALSLTSVASAQIVKVRTAQTCGVIGLDTFDSVRNGVHCAPDGPDAGTSPDAFSLSAVLDGSISLWVGGSHTPSWNLINDTGAALSSLTLYFEGSLASNASIDMQQSGSIFTACASTPFGGSTHSDSHCGTADKTGNHPSLPLEMTWSGGTGLAAGQVFNLGTASFAHAGQDAGRFYFPPNPVPEPETYAMLLAGLGLLGFAARRRRRQ